MNFGQRLKELRKKKRTSQKEFGKLFKLSESAIGMYERNERKPDYEILNKMANFFGVSVDYLIGRSETNNFTDEKKETFCLDQHAEKNDLSLLEANIIKQYMNLDKETREKIMNALKETFNNTDETAAAIENKIDKEVENYRIELLAEEKEATLSALEEQKGKLSS